MVILKYPQPLINFLESLFLNGIAKSLVLPDLRAPPAD